MKKLAELVKKIVRVHTQNFVGERGTRDFGRWPWAHGRVHAWLFSDENAEGLVTLSWEWDAWTSFVHAYTEIKPAFDGSSSRATVGVACGPAVWFGVGGKLVDGIRFPEHRRKFGFSVHDKTIFVDFAADGHDTRNNRHWWVIDKALHPVDAVLGRREHDERVLEVVPVVVCMPEGQYSGTCQVVESTWRRRRWPIVERMVRTKLDVPEGVPFPGKGENSWDCDQDATYGQTGPWRTPEEAVAELVKHVLTRRARNGGRGWKPKSKEPPRGRGSSASD